MSNANVINGEINAVRAAPLDGLLYSTAFIFPFVGASELTSLAHLFISSVKDVLCGTTV